MADKEHPRSYRKYCLFSKIQMTLRQFIFKNNVQKYSNPHLQALLLQNTLNKGQFYIGLTGNRLFTLLFFFKEIK
jgi:hypothetical protein